MGAPRASASERCFPSASSRLPLGFPAVGSIGIKAERNRWSHAKKPHHFFCDRAILTPPFWGYLQKEHSTDGATVGEVLGDRCNSNFWVLQARNPPMEPPLRQQKTNNCNSNLALQKTHSTDGATDEEVLGDRGDPFLGLPKKRQPTYGATDGKSGRPSDSDNIWSAHLPTDQSTCPPACLSACPPASQPACLTGTGGTGTGAAGTEPNRFELGHPGKRNRWNRNRTRREPNRTEPNRGHPDIEVEVHVVVNVHADSCQCLC